MLFCVRFDNGKRERETPELQLAKERVERVEREELCQTIALAEWKSVLGCRGARIESIARNKLNFHVASFRLLLCVSH
jgi:hypothetical protein